MAFAQSLTQLEIPTKGKGFTRLNERMESWLGSKDIEQGVLHLTCLHTSCSLTINENADPRVLKDLAAWMEAVVPQDGKGPADAQGQRRRYLHDDEGDDDMPAHIRTALTSQTMTLSVQNGRLVLGTWQAVYLWEHRQLGSTRRVACHLIGEKPASSTQATATHATTTQTASNQTLLNLRNATRLNQQIQDRIQPEAWAEDGGNATDVDLLIDRLHDISDS
ncbi:secondary thiamine-phosphate synthase enzyme YjbQ [Synechococcus sp. UW179B]|uniref:secondary thiamine-phosphate synthase enzyme YjbQ n=1 Tax=Synechococcus sp. UW179B TaxID=2575516 RepID=UPI000E0FD3D6|nr:secondary thiamine-phosphate synthase enzyme YjbQ [Synechococcus sp. UW179B]